MTGSSRPFNVLATLLLVLTVIALIGAAFILANQYLALNAPTQTQAPAHPTRVVAGDTPTAFNYPTLPPEWTATTEPTTTETQTAATPSQTPPPTRTATRLPTRTLVPTLPGPTRTRRPTLSPTPSATRTPTPSRAPASPTTRAALAQSH